MVEGLEQRRFLSTTRIGVTGNGATIGSNDTTPDRASFTDFGPVALSGTASVVTRDYVVKNTGTTRIYFNNHRQVLGGEDAGQFKIVKGLPTSLAKGKSATVTLSFDPSSTGTQRANLVIHSNASDYKFDIKGSGLQTNSIGSSGLQYALTKSGSGAAAQKGQVLKMNYTGLLLNGKVFDSSLNPGRTPFNFTSEIGNVIKGWQQGLAGTKVGDKRTLFIPSALAYGAQAQGDIPANSTLIFEVETLGIGGPSLKVNTTVSKKTRSITDGDTTPSTGDNTDFGSVKKGETVTKTFTVTTDLWEQNVSNAFFTGTPAVTVSGANAKDFTITPTKDAQGNPSYVTFTVTFKPSGTGKRTAKISFGYTGQSYDPAASSQTPAYTHNDTFDFVIQGTGT